MARPPEHTQVRDVVFWFMLDGLLFVRRWL